MNQQQSTNVKSPTASNWNYGKWLMGKSLEELESMPTTDKLYMKVIEGNIAINKQNEYDNIRIEYGQIIK